MPRPEGLLLWAHLGPGADPAALSLLLARLRDDRGRLALLVTHDGEPPADFDETALHQLRPDDTESATAGFLDHWRPDACLWSGGGWAATLLAQTAARAIPSLAVDARMDDAHARERRWKTALSRAELQTFEHILTGSPRDATRLIAFGAAPDRVEARGWLEISAGALPCNDAEWMTLVGVLEARPVWLAVEVSAAEIPEVIKAHRFAGRLSHRLLLILVPADPSIGPALRERLDAEGWQTALRSAEQEPEEGCQIYVADTSGELGLWYRLAPITFLGQSLVGGGADRSPMEPAALGSVVLHGPQLGRHSAAFARLRRVGAHCQVGSAGELGRAVERFLASDKAAEMAHGAWEELTAGAEAADRALELLNAALSRAKAVR